MARLKSIASALILVALLTALAPAQNQSKLVKATVPFDFRVANRALPAGDYAIRVDDGGAFLTLRNLHSGSITPVLASAEAANARPKLEFAEVDGQRFLSAIATGSAVYELPVRHGKKQLAKLIEVESGGQ